MPTIRQLPQATAINSSDELHLDQGGRSVAATVAQLLGGATVNASGSVTLTGDVSGSGAGTIAVTLAPVVAPGTYGKVTVSAKGLVVQGGSLAAGDVTSALGYTPYDAANPGGFVAASALPSRVSQLANDSGFVTAEAVPSRTSQLVNDSGFLTSASFGSMALQNAASVAITGGSVAGADISGAAVLATGSSLARTVSARAAERFNVLDFGADPSGTGDSAPAFAAAMAAVASGAFGRLFVPRGTYRLNSIVNQPSGRSIGVEWDDGAVLTGSGGLGVDKVESHQGAFTQLVGGGGWFGFNPIVGAANNPPFHSQIIQNNATNSASMRIGWSRNYTNSNRYGKYKTGIDFAEQNLYSWPNLWDNSSGWGHWEVITGSTYDEDTAGRAGLNSSAEHSEFDVVNNGPESGWTFRSGFGNGVQGMSIDPWGQNGLYGGHLLYAYGSVGSFNGNAGGVNQRWISYPAVHSKGNPGAVAQNATLTITFDLSAKASAAVRNGAVTGVSISNGGGAYASTPSVVFSGGGGSGAAGIPVMLGGAVVGVTVTSGGSGYTGAPSVSFSGGGIAAPAPATISLNTDGAHGDLASVAAAINAAAIPNLRAAVAQWGGAVNRLVIFGTVPGDLGQITLAGSALGTLGINAGTVATPRDSYAVAIGGTAGCATGDQFIVNGSTITVGGTGSPADAATAVNGVNLPGLRGDVTGSGRFVLTAWLPQQPAGLVLSQPSGAATLAKLGLNAGTILPPTPPKAFATAYGELTSPVCRTTDAIAISATDLNGTAYGPVTVTLNGGAGTGWVADVAASIQAALTTAGWFSSTQAALTAAPKIVAVWSRNSGANQGLVIRNTAGGTLTLANTNGTPLETLGIAPGTYQPGGYSAASQTVFLAAQNAIAPQGRGVYLGGATVPDQTTWPHAPLEAQGNFLNGLRTDKATFANNAALLLGTAQTIQWGAGGLALGVSGAALTVNGAAVAMAAAVPAKTSQLSNDSGFVAATALPAGAGKLLAATSTAGTAGLVSLGGGLSLSGGTLSATGIGSLPPATATTLGAVSVPVAGRLSVDAAGALSVPLGSATAPGVVQVDGTSVTVNAAGVISAVGSGAAGVTAFNTRTGSVTLASADVTGALGFTPAPVASPSFTGTATAAALTIGSAAAALSVTQTLDAAGYQTVLAQGSGAAANVVLALQPKGGGWLAADLADAGSAGGNARGGAAVDWQQVRGAATQVASGAKAAIGGGQNNTASGQFAAVPGGSGNTASGQGSVAMGQNASDGGAYGTLVFSAGAGGQMLVSQLYANAASGAATRLTADGQAAGAANSVPLASNKGLGGILKVTARNTANGDVALWVVNVLMKNSAGTVSVSAPGGGAIAPTVADSSLATATLTLAADNSNKGLSMTLTPPAGITARASAAFVAAQI